jgi:hypothetical protein
MPDQPSSRSEYAPSFKVFVRGRELPPERPSTSSKSRVSEA